MLTLVRRKKKEQAEEEDGDGGGQSQTQRDFFTFWSKIVFGFLAERFQRSQTSSDRGEKLKLQVKGESI